jgi:hypothetical protein
VRDEREQASPILRESGSLRATATGSWPPCVRRPGRDFSRPRSSGYGCRQLLQQAIDVGSPNTEDGLKARWYADIEDEEWQSALGDARALLANQERAKSENPVQAPRYDFAESTLTRPWLALASARTGNLADARQWMIRSYAVTFFFAVDRVQFEFPSFQPTEAGFETPRAGRPVSLVCSSVMCLAQRVITASRR